MPVYTTTAELACGMKLHQPVYDGTHLLLPAGKPLNSADVEYLRRRCPSLAVSVEDPVLDELVHFDDDAQGRELAHRTQRKLVSLTAPLQDRYGARLTAGSMDCHGIRQAVSGVMTHLQGQPSVAESLIGMGGPEDYLATHAAHVFYLSLMMGNSVRSLLASARMRRNSALHRVLRPHEELDLTPLALAALFMDVGMAPIKDIYRQTEPLTEEQCTIIRNHPTTSAAALGDTVPELTRLIIETHHENFDGTGYPYGLKGDEIHVLARVLRIADAYSAATSAHVYHEASSPVRALWEMTWGTFSQFYDPVLLKVFASLIQPFPIGGRLVLNTGEGGVVVRYGRVSPFLPEIVVAFDERGARLPRERLRGPIKLHEDSTLSIVSFQGEDLTDLYARDTTIEAVTPAEFTTLFESMYTGCAALPRR